MRFDNDSQAASATRTRRRALLSTVIVWAVLALAPYGAARLTAQEHQPAAAAEQGHGEGAGHAAGGEEAHAEGILPTVARVFNFAILAGVLVYFLKTPLATYLAGRSSQIRQDLVTAREMREAASRQLAEIDAKMKSLPAELDALKARGAEDVRLERQRIEQAAAAERDRLLDHTRREIDMRLRVARRDLIEHAAQLAVNVAQARITQTITPEDQIRLVDRYAAQLKEAR